MIRVSNHVCLFPDHAGTPANLPTQVKYICLHAGIQAKNADQTYRVPAFWIVSPDVIDRNSCRFIAEEEIIETAVITVTEASRFVCFVPVL